MRKVQCAFVVFAVVTVAAAQSIEPPISDTRLTVHTLVREDIFAGFLDNDMNRFSRAERNIEALLKERPSEKANLLAWRAGAEMYRAVWPARFCSCWFIPQRHRRRTMSSTGSSTAPPCPRAG